uniref:E2F/DP family winged-helix DNA-binding domain-containing protein n=1 Tax=Marmota marmota marmota TaxID=9994 RepID=A0A8C6AAQ8_MARMA
MLCHSNNVEILPPSKIRRNLEGNVQNASGSRALKGKKPRFNVSLVCLTKRFTDLIKSAPGGILDLNKAATTLGVPKRRLYDITGVLNGIDFVEKKSRNHVQWTGSDLSNSEVKNQGSQWCNSLLSSKALVPESEGLSTCSSESKGGEGGYASSKRERKLAFPQPLFL